MVEPLVDMAARVRYACAIDCKRVREMDRGTKLKKLLALRGSSLHLNGVFASLAEVCEIIEVDELDSALDAMRNNHFDAVLAETSDFLPLERMASSRQAGVVLDTLGEGVCVIGPHGKMVWSNRRMRQFSSVQIESVVNICAKAFESFAESPHTDVGVKRFSLTTDDGAYFEIICSPIFDRQKNLRQIAAVVVEATGRRQRQQTIIAIERVGDELVRLSSDSADNTNISDRLGILKDRIVQCAHDVLDFECLAILLLDQENSRLRWLLAEGLADGVEKTEFLSSMEGNGICGYVAATGKSYLCSNVEKDPRYIPGLAGAGSSLTVPLRLRNRIVGVLNVESTSPARFGQNEQHFIEIFAHFIALAMHMLNLLPQQEGKLAEEAKQPEDDVRTNLAEPLSDIVTESTKLMEDYIGHDDLRSRLGKIIDMIVSVRASTRTTNPPPATIPLPVMPPAIDTAFEQPAPMPVSVPAPVPVPVSVPMPVVTPAPAASKPAERTDTILDGKRILVADDEDIIRKLIHDILAPCGCVIDLAPDGVEAIVNMTENLYDLIITDVNMPGASGYDVLAAAGTNGNQTPVILVTGFGYDPTHSLVQACQNGRVKTLFKPFKVNELIDLCREVVQNSR